MRGYLLLLSFLFVRFGLLSLLSKEAVKRAAYFAPLVGKEGIAYGVYQLSNAGIFIYLLFLKIQVAPVWLFYTGAAVCGLGLLLCAFSVIHFAAPDANGINQNGLYRFSRNPMYISYFIFFIGCTALTQSWVLLAFVLLFQISAHWIILSEERWCIGRFGDEYMRYMKKIRRYL